MEISLRGKKRCIRVYAFFNYMQKTHFVKKILCGWFGRGGSHIRWQMADKLWI